VEKLSDTILWDTNYEDAKLYMDFPPEKSKDLREQAGIPDDYFMAIADDLSYDEAKAQIIELSKLCDSIITSS
jgi:hypothetical protein